MHVTIRSVLIASLLLTALFAQDQPAERTKASEYPAHTSIRGLEIGAEYLVHSVPGAKSYLFAKDYLVIEVALFPSKGERIRIANSQFTLRVNRGKLVIAPDSPGTVAGSIKYPDWERQQAATIQAGPVLLGGPSGVPRFPGDPTQDKRIPQPAGDPTPDSSGMNRPVEKSIDETVALAALAEGFIETPVRGCLFFPFRGKTKKIRSLELAYEPGEGKPTVTIPLL